MLNSEDAAARTRAMTGNNRAKEAAAQASALPITEGRMLQDEKDLILQTRASRSGVAANAPWCGLGLSGGGIRSASLGLGVLQGLAEKDLLKRFDYISSVSGGGYIATSLQ